ncbi:brr6-like protein number 1 [Stylonychia lemnae]|uniref:Brr6-like protein number 1 n=1 Tax=Stylonychia lemnae TaxID=5949 RepID=A0A078AGQ9_STYLE|nr:brr6-like protein number 1 [Stylonychia lemnae]|eukprot:CDW81379.1 brr6-like protein number 1 [Stylonychia lemnae]
MYSTIPTKNRIQTYVNTHYDDKPSYNSDDSSAQEAQSIGSFTANIASNRSSQNKDDDVDEDSQQEQERSYSYTRAKIHKIYEIKKKLDQRKNKDFNENLVNDRTHFKQQISKGTKQQTTAQSSFGQKLNNQTSSSISLSKTPQQTIRAQNLPINTNYHQINNPETDIDMRLEEQVCQDSLANYSREQQEFIHSNIHAIDRDQDMMEEQYIPQQEYQLIAKSPIRNKADQNGQLVQVKSSPEKIRQERSLKSSFSSKDHEDDFPKNSKSYQYYNNKFDSKCDPENMPFILNRYLYLATRFFLLQIFQVKEDLYHKMKTENDQITYEIQQCRIDYHENKCNPSTRVRALEQFCQDKEVCMNRDPQLINKNTKIMVKLLAEIINDFFEPLTYKTMAFMLLSGLCIFMFSECLGRRTIRQQPHQQQSQVS